MPLFVRYSEGALLGLGLLIVFSTIDFGTAAFLELSYVPLVGAIGLCALLILFGGGPGRSGAKVNLGPVQPIEAIRLLLVFFLAGYFARRWELVRGVRSRAIRSVRLPAWMNIPRGEYVLPVLAGVAVALALFAVQKDLGPALLLCCVFLTMYAVARGYSRARRMCRLSSVGREELRRDAAAAGLAMQLLATNLTYRTHRTAALLSAE